MANSQPKMSRALQRRENVAGYLFMLPSLIFFIGFVVAPMIICIGYSFTDANMNSKTVATTFVGLKNFIDLWQDPVKPVLSSLCIYGVSSIYSIPLPIAAKGAFSIIFTCPMP